MDRQRKRRDRHRSVSKFKSNHAVCPVVPDQSVPSSQLRIGQNAEEAPHRQLEKKNSLQNTLRKLWAGVTANERKAVCFQPQTMSSVLAVDQGPVKPTRAGVQFQVSLSTLNHRGTERRGF